MRNGFPSRNQILVVVSYFESFEALDARDSARCSVTGKPPCAISIAGASASAKLFDP